MVVENQFWEVHCKLAVQNERNNCRNLNILVGSELVTTTAPAQGEKGKENSFHCGQSFAEIRKKKKEDLCQVCQEQNNKQSENSDTRLIVSSSS